MNNNSNQTIQKLDVVARMFFYLSLILMLTAVPIVVLLQVAANNWLQLFVFRLFWLGGFLMLTHWIVPGIFIFLGKPSFALAWLQGIRPTRKPLKLWSELSNGEKIVVYFYSVVSFAVAIIGLIMMITNQ